MRLITIISKDDLVWTEEGKIDGSRREYVVRDQLEIYLSGPFTENNRELANILAQVICQDMNIPLTMLVAVDKPKAARVVKRHQNSRPLF